MRVLLREVTFSGQTRIESICDLLILLNLRATDAHPRFKMAAEAKRSDERNIKKGGTGTNKE